MNLQLRPRDKRALLVLGIGIGAYLALAQLVLPAYDRMQSQSEAVTQKEEDLRRYRRALASRDRYTQLLNQVRTSVTAAEARLVRGDNSSLASVELQTIVEEAAGKVVIDLGQRSMTPARKRDDFFNEITMSLSFESTPNQLTAFLGELRAAPKFVTVRNLQVAPVTAIQELPAQGVFKKTIRTTLTVAALLSSPPAGS